MYIFGKVSFISSFSLIKDLKDASTVSKWRDFLFFSSFSNSFYSFLKSSISISVIYAFLFYEFPGIYEVF
jgi:hypothetical protein